MKKILKSIVIKIIEWQAQTVLKRNKPYIIAITGNVGKTSTKEAVYQVLSSSYHVRKSQKSFNSEIGVPLTILGCPTGWSNPFIWFRNILKGFWVILFSRNYPKYLVLEVGADQPGDIKRICSWLFPDVSVVTAIGETPVHIENFSSREELIEEKTELIRSLKSSGRAVLNIDDEDVYNMRSFVEGGVLFYGFSEKADIKASNYIHTYDKEGRVNGFSFKINYNGNSVPFSFKGFLGRQHVYAVLSSVSLGILQNINMVDIKESLVKYIPQPGRVNLLKGKRNSTIIDDSYNSSPTAIKAVLREMKEIESTGRKIVILGDMMDLGNYTHKEHRKMVSQALEFCDYLITVGPRSRVVTEEVDDEKKDRVFVFSNSDKLVEKFPLEINSNDLILVKGSQAVRMEKVTEMILDDQKLAKDLLVRQDNYWKKI